MNRPSSSIGAPSHPTGIDHLILGAILLSAAFLRLIHIGALGLWIDEGITWMVTHQILNGGLPQVASGEPYTRGPLYSYLIAVVRALAGGGEAALRIPSLIFTLATIAVAYRFAFDLAGRAVATIAALILLFSPWELHYAQLARMYALLSFLFLFTVHAIYRVSFQDDQRAKHLALAGTVLAIFTHQLGAVLAVVYLSLFLLPRDHRPSTRWILGGVFTVALSFVVLKHLPFRQSLVLIDKEYRGGLLQMPLLPPIDLNHSQVILFEVLRSRPLLGAAAALSIVGAGFLLLIRLVRLRRSRWVLSTAAGFTVALLWNQLVVASLFGVCMVKLGERSTRGAGELVKRLFLVAAVAVAAVAGTAVLTEGPGLLRDRFFWRLFFSMPHPFYRLLFLQFPLMFATTAAGGAYIILRSLPPGRDQRGFFLVAAFLSSLLLMGFFHSPYVSNRYDYYLNPLFVILFAWITFGWTQNLLRRWLGPQRSALRIWAQGILIAVVLGWGCEGFDPLQTWAASHRSYGYNKERVRTPDLNASFHYDYPGCAEFVARHRKPGDLIVAMQPVGLYPYGVHPDYRIAKLDGVYALSAEGPVDWYTGSPILAELPSLQAVLEANPGKPVWIIYTDEIPGGPDVNIPRDTLDFLRSERSNQLYSASDGASRVVYLPARNNEGVLDREANPGALPAPTDPASAGAGLPPWRFRSRE